MVGIKHLITHLSREPGATQPAGYGNDWVKVRTTRSQVSFLQTVSDSLCRNSPSAGRVTAQVKEQGVEVLSWTCCQSLKQVRDVTSQSPHFRCFVWIFGRVMNINKLSVIPWRKEHTSEEEGVF